jgi:hypothetical protein
VTSITDNQSDTYVSSTNSRGNDSAGGDSIEIWYSKNIAAGATSVTINASSSFTISAWVYEVAGADTSTPLDIAHNTINGASCASCVGPSATTTAANEFVLTAISPVNNVTAVSAPWTLDTVLGGHGSAYQIVTSTGNYVATWTVNTAGTFAGSIATFQQALPAAPLSPNPAIFLDGACTLDGNIIFD